MSVSLIRVRAGAPRALTVIAITASNDRDHKNTDELWRLWKVKLTFTEPSTRIHSSLGPSNGTLGASAI